jgi:hypothetical protein
MDFYITKASGGSIAYQHFRPQLQKTFNHPLLGGCCSYITCLHNNHHDFCAMHTSVSELDSTWQMLASKYQCGPWLPCWRLNPPLSLRTILSLLIFVSAYSAFLDFAFALYPVLQISKLQMERSKKIILGGSMSLGFLYVGSHWFLPWTEVTEQI